MFIANFYMKLNIKNQFYHHIMSLDLLKVCHFYNLKLCKIQVNFIGTKNNLF